MIRAIPRLESPGLVEEALDRGSHRTIRGLVLGEASAGVHAAHAAASVEEEGDAGEVATVSAQPPTLVDILLDVTNAGRWMAPCHIAEHHESGMMLSFDVDP
jgi:uncharacterized cupredoxin-like copper-binding protein